MRDRLIELLEEAKTKAQITIGSLNNGWGAWYADYLLENGVIVPPCEVGDVLWAFSYGKIVCGEVVGIKYECEAENHGVFIRNRITTIGELTATVDFCDIGKTVFLSRGDAERALQQSKEKELKKNETD